MKILEKSEKADLTKDKGLTGIVIGCGWDAVSNGPQFDADASAFALDQDGKVITDKHFVYYGNLASPDNCIVHSGDNLTGKGDGDDERITVDFSKVPDTVQEIVIVVNIYQGAERNQNFGKVKNAFIRICETSMTEIMRYDLSEDASVATAMIFGKLYRHNGEWKFQAIGEGDKKGLQHYSNMYAR